MDQSPILSIIIPTKNRYEYLIYSLRSIINNFKDFSVEIIVHDNSTDEIPQDILEIINSEKSIQYTKIDHHISGWENFELAITKANGKYLTMIGDDDSLSKYVIDVVEFMDKNNIMSVISPFATYTWPDLESRIFKSKTSSQLSLKKFGGKISYLRAEKELDQLVKSGGTNLFQLPKMYYGIVNREIVEKVKESSGYFLPGPSPDMANAVSMAVFLEKIVHVDIPIFIAGNSSKSTAGMGAKGEHLGKIEDIKFLPENCSREWDPWVPKYWSGPTIWAQSAVKALEGTKANRKINYLNLYAHCYVFNSSYKDYVDDAKARYIKENNLNLTLSGLKIFYYSMLVWLRRLYFFGRNVLSVKLNLFDIKTKKIDNVLLATEKLDQFIANKKVLGFKC